MFNGKLIKSIAKSSTLIIRNSLMILDEVKEVKRELKRLRPEKKIIVREINYFEELSKRARGRGNTEYILTAASKNPNVIIISRDIEECKRLKAVFTNNFPTSMEPMFLSVDEYERKKVPDLPVMIDMSVFSVKSSRRYNFNKIF